MGRQLRRVPLDFEWPINKVWEGFLNPHYTATPCPHCEGGYSSTAKHLKDLWYGYAPFRPEDRGSKPFTPDTPEVRAFAERNCNNSPGFYGSDPQAVRREAQRLCELFNGQWSHHLNADDVTALVEAGRLHDFTHTWSREHGWQIKEPPYTPTPDEVNRWSLSGFGHDSINQWTVCKAECQRLGKSPTCEHCNGEGDVWPSPEAKALYDSWQQVEPPAGEGYQVWDTVSEGSPISPVFLTPQTLALWLSRNNKGVDVGTSYSQWLEFITGSGWAPSMVAVGGEVLTGVQAENL